MKKIPVVLYVVLDIEKVVAIEVVVVETEVVVEEVVVVVLYVVIVVAKVTPRKLDAKSARVWFPAPVYPVTVMR